jgi:hypothetical protein
MKQCPKCNQTYTDDTLNFCLEDGEWLIGDQRSDDPPTAVLSEEDAATRPWVTDTGGSTRPTSSAEYIVGEVKRHKVECLRVLHYCLRFSLAAAGGCLEG